MWGDSTTEPSTVVIQQKRECSSMYVSMVWWRNTVFSWRLVLLFLFQADGTACRANKSVWPSSASRSSSNSRQGRGSLLQPLWKEKGPDHLNWRNQFKICEDTGVPYTATLSLWLEESRAPPRQMGQKSSCHTAWSVSSSLPWRPRGPDVLPLPSKEMSYPRAVPTIQKDLPREAQVGEVFFQENMPFWLIQRTNSSPQRWPFRRIFLMITARRGYAILILALYGFVWSLQLEACRNQRCYLYFFIKSISSLKGQY